VSLKRLRGRSLLLTKPALQALTNVPYAAAPAQPYAGSYISRGHDGRKVYGGMGVNSGGTDQSDWWEYDTSLNTWTSKAGAPSAGQSGTACTIGQYIYVIGSTNTNCRAVRRYDCVNNTWSSMTALGEDVGLCNAIPFPKAGTSGQIFIPYHRDSTAGTGSGNTYLYDVALNTWTAKAAFTGWATPNYGYGCQWGDDDTAAFAGGYNQGAGTQQSSTRNYRLSTNTWLTPAMNSHITGVSVNTLAPGSGESIEGIGLCWGSGGADGNIYEFDLGREMDSDAAAGYATTGQWQSSGGWPGKLNSGIAAVPFWANGVPPAFYTHNRDLTFYRYRPKGNRRGLIERVLARI